MRIKEVLLMTLLAIMGGVQGYPDERWKNPCYPCICYNETYFTCNYIRDIDQLQKVIDEHLDYRIDMLSINHSNLPYLNASWLTKTLQLKLQNTTLVDLFNRPSGFSQLKTLTVEQTLILRGVRWSNYFKPFEELQTIKLMSTQVKKFGKKFRENVTPNLKKINMQDTGTLFLADGDFDGKKLEEIQITKNRIKFLKNSYFKDQKDSLTLMDFSDNPIESLPDDLFKGFKKLARVHLNNCEIKYLSKGLRNHAPKYLRLEFLGNPLECDCEMKWVIAFVRVYRSDIHGTCATPPNLKSKNLADLKESDFTYCNLKK